jgi:hypothetical protein
MFRAACVRLISSCVSGPGLIRQRQRSQSSGRPKMRNVRSTRPGRLVRLTQPHLGAVIAPWCRQDGA